MPTTFENPYIGLNARSAPTPDETDGPPELADVGRLARRTMRRVVGAARADEREARRVTLSSLLRDHLGADTAGRSIVEESWRRYEQVNLQAGLNAWLRDSGVTHELIGIIDFHHEDIGLADLLGSSRHSHGPRPGNVALSNVPCGPDGQVMPCVRCGLYLVGDGDQHSALLLGGGDHHDSVTLEVVSTDDANATWIAAEIRQQALVHNVFRRQVLSFGGGDVFGHGETLLTFHRRQALDSSQLIMPAETLRAIQQQVVEVARHKQRLLAAGQHLKRGVLLYGPPGTGKTHTLRYLIGSLTDTTVVQLTGGALHLISEACSVARTLAPAMIVVEDVDLIAEDRGMYPGQHPMLFQLLNEMDGLAEDADVVFVLTTNRADLLEPALAARPGRVDQAVELTMPDLESRRRLFDLYRGGLDIDRSRLDEVLARAEGVTASFLKELTRRAALVAATRSDDDGGELHVTADDLDAALAELLHTRNAMTRVLLGGSAPGARSSLDDQVEREAW